jgi:hypothetical protein
LRGAVDEEAEGVDEAPIVETYADGQRFCMTGLFVWFSAYLLSLAYLLCFMQTRI